MKEYVVNNFKAINYQYAVGQLSICIDLEECSLETMMFEKYPSISPYTYCANNPMKFVDPTGETLEEGDGDPPPGMLFINQKKITPPLATNSGENGTATNSPPKPSSSSKPTVTNTATSNSSPSKPTQSSGTGQATMKDFYRQQLKEATGLDKNMEYAIRYVAESMGLPSEKDVINAVAPILEGAVLFNPLVGVPNGVYTAVAGEDIYGNEASTANRIISGVGVVAGGVGKVASGVASTVAKGIDWAIDAYTAYLTTREGYKKQNKK
jgi:hypothetical protein